MKNNVSNAPELRYSTPETESLSLECQSFIAASGNVKPDPWASGNSDWCN